MFSQPSSERLVFGLTAGRDIALASRSDLPNAKLDFNASYHDISDDPMRQDRAIATVTLTQKLLNATDLSVSLAWANKPEFLGDVDKELGARIGLSYKFASSGAEK